MGLFKPKWMSPDQAVAMEALGKIQDDRALRDIVITHGVRSDVRLAALRRIAGQDVLLDIFAAFVRLPYGIAPEVLPLIISMLDTPCVLFAAEIFAQRVGDGWRGKDADVLRTKVSTALYERHKNMTLQQKQRLLDALKGTMWHSIFQRELAVEENGKEARWIRLLDSWSGNNKEAAFHEFVKTLDMDALLWLEAQLPVQDEKYKYRSDVGDLLITLYRSEELPDAVKEFAKKQRTRIKTDFSPGESGNEHSGAISLEYLDKKVVW